MRDDEDGCEKNQQMIGMKQLFRCFSAKAWKGSQDNKKNCTNLNRIVNQHCMACYCKCWKDRKEKLHDEETQKKEQSSGSRKRMKKL